MTTFYLIRHAANDFLGRALAGRLPDVHLNERGRAEASAIAERLRDAPVQQIISSPMERCRETAQPLANALGLPVASSDALNEVDFGDWKGAEMQVLDADVRWQRWNSFRTGHVIPHGEPMVAIQARMAAEMIRLKNAFPGQHVVLVSHGDPIRAALCYWLGIPLDFLHRLQVDPGSISMVRVDDQAAIVESINVR